MRFDLGAGIIVVTLAFLIWAARKLYMPAKRQPGMRIKLSSAKRDERDKDGVEP